MSILSILTLWLWRSGSAQTLKHSRNIQKIETFRKHCWWLLYFILCWVQCTHTLYGNLNSNVSSQLQGCIVTLSFSKFSSLPQLHPVFQLPSLVALRFQTHNRRSYQPHIDQLSERIHGANCSDHAIMKNQKASIVIQLINKCWNNSMTSFAGQKTWTICPSLGLLPRKGKKLLARDEIIRPTCKFCWAIQFCGMHQMTPCVVTKGATTEGSRVKTPSKFLLTPNCFLSFHWKVDYFKISILTTYTPNWTIWSSKFQKISGEGLTYFLPRPLPCSFLGLAFDSGCALKFQAHLRLCPSFARFWFTNFWRVVIIIIIKQLITYHNVNSSTKWNH